MASVTSCEMLHRVGLEEEVSGVRIFEYSRKVTLFLSITALTLSAMLGSLVRSTRKPPPPAPVKVCPIMKTFTEVMTSDQSPSPGITSLSYKEYLVGICSKPYPTFVAKIYHLSPLFSFESKWM